MKQRYEEIERWDVSDSDWKIFVVGILMEMIIGGMGVMTFILDNTI